MSERVLQYSLTVFLCAVSFREYLNSGWLGAFYFLLAAGFLALWIELHKGDGEKNVYHNCSWFMTPPPPLPDATKENPHHDSDPGRNS